MAIWLLTGVCVSYLGELSVISERTATASDQDFERFC